VTIEYFLTRYDDMKFITVRDLRTSPGKIWKELPEEGEMVITSNGKPVALMTPISDSDLEERLAALRRVRTMTAVKEMQGRSMEQGTDRMSEEEINREILKARNERS
jgi:prevent-host-death family protein